jgi:hypothetical protein
MNVSLAIDGKPLPTLTGYNSRCQECTAVNRPFTRSPSHRFAGYYWDATAALRDHNNDHSVVLELQQQGKISSASDVKGLFFENVEPIYTHGISQFSTLEPVRSHFHF